MATISSSHMNLELGSNKIGPFNSQALPIGVDIWSGCDQNSKLKIPFSELKELYTRHLLLKEVILVELSLYILSLSFLSKKEKAFILYEEEKENAFTLLNKLEDRFINGVVSYRLGYCHANCSSMGVKNLTTSHQFYFNAYQIFKNQKGENPSPLELFYLGAIYKDGKGGAPRSNEEALRYYGLSASHGFGKALVNLGCAYRDGDGVEKSYEKAVMYFEKAAAQNFPAGMCHLAYMMEFGYGTARELYLSNELYKNAAKHGDQYSFERCKVLGLEFGDKRRKMG